MTTYHKINSPFKRNMESKPHNIIVGDWAVPEFELLQGCLWRGWEKIDGTNIRIIYSPLFKTIEFKGRTDNADIPKHLLEVLKERFTLEMFEKHFGTNGKELFDIVLYGEGTGHKIQSGGKYWKEPKKVDFILFDIRIEKWWMLDSFVEETAEYFNVHRAPYLGTAPLNEWMKLERVGQQSKFGDFIREGVIVRPLYELFDRSGSRVITKIKHKDFKDVPVGHLDEL